MSKAKIYITEDEFIVAKNLEKKLTKLGFEVVGSSNTGEDALINIPKLKPDLVLMDIMLAGDLNGIETAGKLNKVCKIPIIFLTAYSSPEVLKKAMDIEPYAYIIKPFEERELLINIEIALYKSRVEKELIQKQKELELMNENLDEIVQKRTHQLKLKNRELEQEIVSRKRAQEKERIFDAVINQSNENILITNTKGIIEYINPSYQEFLGYEEEELIGERPSLFKSGMHSDLFYQDLWSTVLKGEMFRCEMINKRKSGKLFNEEKIIFPLKDNAGNITHLASLGRDSSQKKKAERLKVKTEEKERERISKELHDGIGQSITAIKYLVGSLLKQEGLSSEGKKKMRDVKELLDETTQELRVTSFNLMPSVLKDYGLESALKKVISNLSKNSEIEINLNIDSSIGRFNKDSEIGIYRIIQEGLNNAIKHSKAKSIDVKLEQKEGDVMIMVKDNGVGFAGDATLSNSMHLGQGIENMKYRASLMNGVLEISTDKKNGTSIKAIIPSNVNYE